MFKISNRRYTGSKAQLTDWIMNLTISECPGNSFLDLFAGTGVVAEAAASHYKHVHVNDFLYSNFAAYQAFFGSGKYSVKKLASKVDEYNAINGSSLPKNYFSTSYGGKYFSVSDAKKIGEIRERIGLDKSLTKREYWILLVSLMYSADKIANTVGHYDAYFKKPSGRTKFSMKLIQPTGHSKFSIYREDSNKLVKTLAADVVYIDPPYNSRQYSRFYHVLENLISWKKPRLFGVARKPAPENASVYSKSGAKDAFSELIRDLKCKYIVVSYNNTYNSKSSSSKNKILLEDIENILGSKGSTKIFSKAHKHFNSGKTKFDDHKEYLFITKVN